MRASACSFLIVVLAPEPLLEDNRCFLFAHRYADDERYSEKSSDFAPARVGKWPTFRI